MLEYIAADAIGVFFQSVVNAEIVGDRYYSERTPFVSPAPEEPRDVATGEAQRNPWKVIGVCMLAPEGATESRRPCRRFPPRRGENLTQAQV